MSEPVDETNARYDVNMSGTINTLDMLAVQTRMGNTVARAGLRERMWSAVSGWWCKAVDGVKQRFSRRKRKGVS